MMKYFADYDNLGVNFRFYYLSTLAKRVPTVIWYVGGRVLMYKGVGLSGSIILNAILMENTLIGIAGAILFIILTPFYTFVTTELMLWVSSVIGIAGIFIILGFPQTYISVLNGILARFGKQTISTVPARDALMTWEGLYVLTCCFAGGSFYYLIRSLTGMELRIVDVLGISLLSMIISLISMILPGGLGLKELTVTALLSFWMPFSTALVISIAFRLVQTVDEILWALVALGLPAPVNRMEPFSLVRLDKEAE
jgi:hypothetical protein